MSAFEEKILDTAASLDPETFYNLPAPAVEVMTGLAIHYALQKEQVGELTATIEKLSVDEKTELIYLNSFGVGFDKLAKAGVLQEMHNLGYSMTLRFVDVNEMGLHNRAGGHSGGDQVLEAVANKFQTLYKRGKNLMPTLDMPDRILEHVRSGESIDEQMRYAKGDEILLVTFNPPGPRSNEQGIADELRILHAFHNLQVTYPANTEHLPPGDFTLNEQVNTVTAGVSITFGVATIPVPLDRTSLRVEVERVDKAMMKLKERRQGPAATVGVSLPSAD